MKNAITYKDLNKAIKIMNAELQDLVFVENQNEDVVELKVNWCSIGAVDTKRALEMVALIQKAAEMAENFAYNGYEISYDY